MEDDVVARELLGRLIGGRYLIKKLIRQTSKSWVFEALEKGEFTPGRVVAVKILKPWKRGERAEQFLKEVARHGKLGEHPNIASLYSTGKDGDYLYAAMEFVRGKDLDEEISSGRKFSLEEIIKIMTDISGASQFIHEKVGGHHDLKLKNIKSRKEKGEKIFVLDFGGRIRDAEESNDVYGLGKILDELVAHSDKRTKDIKRLEDIVQKSYKKEYEKPADFKKAVGSVKKRISRRALLKKSAIAGGKLLILGGLAKIGYEEIKYKNSFNYIIDKIKDTDAQDSKKITPLFRELFNRLSYQKILPLAHKIPAGKFPYAISENGTEWSFTDGTYWTSGFWPGILWHSFKATKNPLFKNLALSWVDKMKFSERDAYSLNLIRFFYSHALGYELTKNKNLFQKAIKSAELLAERFNPYGEFIQASGKITNSNTQYIYTSPMTLAIPFLSWAFQKTKNKTLEKIICQHCDTTAKLNLNNDGSIIQVIKFAPDGSAPLIGVKLHGYRGKSCLSRGQARAVVGFSEAYKITKNKKYLELAEKCADYFIENLPKDFVPFYDFKDPNKKIPKDSSASAIFLRGLAELFNLTQNKEYNYYFNEILKSLAVNYFSRDKNYSGFILHGCSNKNKGAFTDSSLIYGDYYFLKFLNKKN